jgi:hypothetical protein
MAVYREPGEADVYIAPEPPRPPWPHWSLVIKLALTAQAPLVVGALYDAHESGAGHVGLMVGAAAFVMAL